jgi:transaldolase/glucose-6-phosphate isomerase
VSAGTPRAHIEAELPADLGAEFFRWQFATAVAGALLGVNPFDQPDVESSKVVTRRYVERMKAGDTTEPGCIVRLSEVSALGLAQLLGTHLATFPDGGYAVVSAYLDRSDRNRELLQTLRRRVAGATGGAAVLGFGPSFLHSTGQAHKGGPNRGLFVQITADPPASDISVPGEGLTFGQVQLAQAWGDHEVLVERGRRVLAVHCDGDVEAELRRLIEAVG